jgi:hypothetical protein
MNETWKDVCGYEGSYQVSSLGRVKNLSRMIARSRGGLQQIKENILTPYVKEGKYSTVNLSVNGKSKTQYIHRLVAFAFFGKSNLVVDHINGIKHDNRVSNLRYCTQRENVTFDNVKNKSPYTGVSMNAPNYTNRYRARIRIDGKLKDLGSFFTKEEAHAAWKKKSQELIEQQKLNNI